MADKKKTIDKTKTQEPVGLIPTGSTLLNLALTDNPRGGFQSGRVINLVGDSSSGKSLMALTMMADMACMPEYDNYDLILDDAENAMSFNLSEIFSPTISDRINTEDYSSSTIQSFYGTMQELIQSGKPFVYVLDSLDALGDEAEIEKDKRFMKSPEERTKKEMAGDYGMGIAKFSTKTLKNIVSAISKSGSLLVVISQTRDNIGFGFEKKRRSGGHALKFFSSAEIWLSTISSIKQTVGGNERIIGVKGRCKIKKNKMTGKIRECPITIYYDYGIDDIGENVDFLVQNGVWKKQGRGYITSYCNGEKISRAKLIQCIEDKGQKEILKLQQLVGETWKEIEDSHKLKRKKRYERT